MNDGLLIHAGINFFLSPVPKVDKRKGLDFQHHLLEQGLEVKSSSYEDNTIMVLLKDPQVEVKVASVGPGVGQLLIVAPKNPGDTKLLGENGEAVVKAYKDTWPSESYLIHHCDSTLRFLYETNSEHAFKELWENRLKQTGDSLAVFGPILGGGLRFVISPIPQDKEPHLVEIKIESFLADTDRIFVEAQFKWEQLPQNANFDVLERLQEINTYVEDRVCSFIDGE